jgi:hypothetical protein
MEAMEFMLELLPAGDWRLIVFSTAADFDRTPEGDRTDTFGWNCSQQGLGELE